MPKYIFHFQPAKSTVVGNVLQFRSSDIIKFTIPWDSSTGSPLADDSKQQCQQSDQPPAPPHGCIMVVNALTSVPLPCSSTNAPAFVC